MNPAAQKPSAAALAQLFEPIREDLREVEREFARHVQSQVALIPTIGDYIRAKDIAYLSDMESMLDLYQLRGKLQLTEVYSHYCPLINDHYKIYKVDPCVLAGADARTQ